MAFNKNQRVYYPVYDEKTNTGKIYLCKVVDAVAKVDGKIHFNISILYRLRDLESHMTFESLIDEKMLYIGRDDAIVFLADTYALDIENISIPDEEIITPRK